MNDLSTVLKWLLEKTTRFSLGVLLRGVTGNKCEQFGGLHQVIF